MDDYTEHVSKSTHCVERFVKLNQLREANEFCDVTLIAEGRRLRAHRNVLSAGSPYFWKMFTSSMLERNKEEISIPGINFETLEQVIQFLYTSRVRLTTETAQNILIAANFLQMLDLVEICGIYAVRLIDVTNCFSMRELFKTANCDEKIIARANDFIYKNFKQISLNESFSQLDINSVVELLSDTAVCCKSEEDVVHAAIRWLNAISDRKRYAQQIFACIRIPFLSETFKSEYIDNNPLFSNALDNKIIEPSHVSRTLKTSLLALNQTGENSLHVYDSSTKEWTKLIDIEQKHYTKLAAGSSFVFLAGPEDDSHTNYFFDVLDLKTMRVTSAPPLPHVFGGHPIFEVIVIENRLYVFGHNNVPREMFTTRIAMFDAEQGQWDNEFEALPSLYGPEFFAIGKYIYLFQMHKPGTKIQKLDIQTRTWEDVSLMPDRQSFHMNAPYNGKIYFANFSTRKRKTYPNKFKVFDSTTNEIKLLAPMRDSQSYGLIATSNGIYAHRCIYEDQQIVKREFDFYDAINDEWQYEVELPDGWRAPLFTSIPNLYCPQ